MKTDIFEPFSKTSSGRRAATLLATHAHTSAQLFNAVRAEVAVALPYLIEGGKYSAEQLCGPELWSLWRTAEKRTAGMCLAYQVKVGAIGMVVHVTPSGKGKKRYCLPSVKGGVATFPICLATNRSCQLPSACRPLNITVGEH